MDNLTLQVQKDLLRIVALAAETTHFERLEYEEGGGGDIASRVKNRYVPEVLWRGRI